MTATYPATGLWPLRHIEDDPLAFLAHLASSGEDLVPFRLGRRQAYLVNHARHVEEVLVRHPDVFVKGRGFARAKRLLGEGLLTAEGALHARRRRAAQPAFHHLRMASYGATVVARAAVAGERWRPGQRIDVAQDMQALTLDIAGRTLFGADLEPVAGDVRDAIAAAMPVSMDGLVSLLGPSSRVRHARRRLDAIVDDIVARRVRSGERGDDVLGLLIEAGDPADSSSMPQLRDDVLTLLLAAHDTLSHALTWTWMLLATHEQASACLWTELDEVFGGRVPTADAIARLSYTRSVLAESLRLYPPAWVIVRRARVTHRCGDVEIPAGAVVVVSPFVAHRDARVFDAPLEFRPERWLANGETRPKWTYLPFGAGPRSCIGEGFAWLEGTLALATLAQRWRLVPEHELSMAAVPRITLRPKGPVVMRVMARD